MKRSMLNFLSVVFVGLLALALIGCVAQPPVVTQEEAAEEVEEAAVEVEEAAEEVEEAAEEAAEEVEEVVEEMAGDEFTTIFGEKLPDDAAPYDMQVYTMPCNINLNHVTFDFQVAVYQRFCLGDLFQDQLVVLDKDFNTIPASAESWEVSDDGLTWTFHIKPGLEWSDGTSLTAHDWEATFQMIASPEHAWDFAWFYAGVIQNWDEAIAGEVDPTDLGVKAVDDLTLEITTVNPWPALPAMMVFSFVNQKKALEEHGPLYNSDPATSVSAGPFMLDVLEPGDRVELVANPNYKGYRKPRLQRLIARYQAPETDFVSFQSGEVDKVPYETLSPADFEIIQSDPVLSENYLRHFGDFRTDYLLFDTFNPPFNDLNVRKAFAYAVDREAIVSNVYGDIKAMPAHSMLMPGYPASDVEGKLKDLQTYDCDQAKQFLADAGYPDGEGFPAQEMWLRAEPPTLQAVYQAVAASIQQCLGVTIEVSNQDFKAYMDALNAKPTQLTLGGVSYGMDFLDPSNLLGIWVSTGRHSWKNDEFDSIIAEASSKTDDLEERRKMFEEAQRILVDDVGGIFIAHRWQGDLFQPFVQGSGIREPDSQGIAAWHWGNDWVWSNIYISKDVENFDTYHTK